MQLAAILGSVLGAFALTAWISHRFLSPSSFFHILDHPNPRSLHDSPIPRSGGVAILGGALLGGVAAVPFLPWSAELAGLAAAALGVGAVSFADDRLGLPRRYRLAAHLLAGILLILLGLGVDRLDLPGSVTPIAGLWVWPLTLFYVAWMINLYNFMDGMDGLAGGMALIGFGALGAIGWIGDDLEFAWPNWVIAAAAGGFLVWNWPPARIFMGDVGSSALGFLVAAMSLWGSARGLFPLWVPGLIFSLFIIDATSTLLRRLFRGERIWEAHRSHHYQRIVQAGWGHRKTLMWSLALMLACAATAIQGLGMPPRDQWLVLGAWAGIFIVIGWKTTLLEGRGRLS